ncbi:MAG: hypothetical protein JMDDDDMK_03648 [Acidobacteria bacterium]|nr:hypothetical protein [Acidobacteriota bacterium]
MTVSSKKRSVMWSGSACAAWRKFSIAPALFSPSWLSASCAQLATMASRAVWACSGMLLVFRNFCSATMRAFGSSIARTLSIDPCAGVSCVCAGAGAFTSAQINAHINIHFAHAGLEHFGLTSNGWVFIRPFASLETARLWELGNNPGYHCLSVTERGNSSLLARQSKTRR